ncbi:hypothetical protein Y032_1058g3512 [Ancylostoma ceylanicum]|uniref:DUF7083 domain-containing protein n=1 Tax=Ancylostoma ceylanicum TaxID=53326 RepID=A0A016W6E8_9BILA|nr:hypothetical protein Y032_1058g3512 [Ancylostoma ceylanicum]
MITVCIFNARTLASEASIENLMIQAKKIRYEVIGLTETRRHGPLNATFDTEKNCFSESATVKTWYRRHADIFTVDAKSLDEATRVRLLLHKLDAPSYEKYVNYILPQTPQEVKFDDAISTLKDLFGPQQSLFSTRYTCLKLTKDPKDDFATYAGRVNRECAKFKLAECNENQFKCLIFVCGLQSSEDAFIRLKLLDKIESDPNCTIQILAEECKRLLNLRHDTKMIENGSPVVHSVKQFLPSRQGQQKVNSKTNAQATHPEVIPRTRRIQVACGTMPWKKTPNITITVEAHRARQVVRHQHDHGETIQP